MTTDLLSEAARMRRVPGIIFVDGAAGRRARVGGTGIEVFEVIGTYHALADDLARLIAHYDWLREDQVRAAVHYYAAFPEEIDAEVEDNLRCLEWIERHAPLVPPFPPYPGDGAR